MLACVIGTVTKIAKVLFVVWLLGLPIVMSASDLPQTTKNLFLTAIMWVPMLVIGVVSLLAWLEARLAFLRRR